MKAVRIEGYMQTAHFNIAPWKGGQQRSYPLPPYSTVIGMIHSLCKWNTYHEMKVSICGSSASETEELCTRWTGGCFSGTETEEFKKRFPVRIWNGRGYIGYVRKPQWIHILIDLRLRIHLIPKDEKSLEEIFQVLLHPPVYPALGRHEDLIHIDQVDIVEIDPEKEKKMLDLNAYVPIDSTTILGTMYNLNKNYIIKNNRRVFNKEKVILLSAGAGVFTETDTDGNPVFLV